MEFKTAHDNITLHIVQGIVLEHSSNDDTHVSATFVSNDFAGGTQISTKTTKHHKVWIKTIDGQEVCFDSINSDLELRNGHDLKVLVGVVGSSGYQFVVGVKNLSTGQVVSLWEHSQFSAHSRFNKPWFGLLSLAIIGGVSGLVVTMAVGYLEVSNTYSEAISLSGYVVPVSLALLKNLSLYRKAAQCKAFLNHAAYTI